MGASPSSFGTVRAQLSLRQSFLTIDSIVVGKPEVMVFQAHERFDHDGRLKDEATRELVASLLGALVAAIEASRAEKALHAA
jgi:chromate reductase, NAD(P)H dehydrogenase (quinone)